MFKDKGQISQDARQNPVVRQLDPIPRDKGTQVESYYCNGDRGEGGGKGYPSDRYLAGCAGRPIV